MTKILRFILILSLLIFTPQCYALEDFDVITDDYDGLSEEIHEEVHGIDDSINYVENKNKYNSIFVEVEDNLDSEFNFFTNFDKPSSDSSKPEGPLFARIMKKNIIRTDVPQYLLKDELTFNYEKGPISKVQFMGAYQGNLRFNWNEAQYTSTNYNFGFTQIGAIGKFADNHTDFKILFNPRPVDNLSYMQNFVADAYIVNNRIPHHKLIIGQSRNAVGFEGASSSYILPFVTRSQIARNFGSTRALGAKIIGNYSLVDYSLAVNSSDRFFHEFFPGAEFTGWVNLKPFGKTDGKYGSLVVGGGLNAGRNNTNYTVGGLYIGYRYKKFMTNFEYAIADGYNGSYVSTNKATGFYGTVGYKITPHVQLIARFDQFDPDRNISGNLKREITAGINWFIKGQALRIILNYVYCMNQNQSDSSRIILATQFLF